MAGLPKGHERTGFSRGTPDGAKASANLYSLIETAKANKLEPYKYVRYLFEKIPFAEYEADYKALLPMNLNVDLLVLADKPLGFNWRIHRCIWTVRES